jgi:hypothetical protein
MGSSKTGGAGSRLVFEVMKSMGWNLSNTITLQFDRIGHSEHKKIGNGTVSHMSVVLKEESARER